MLSRMFNGRPARCAPCVRRGCEELSHAISSVSYRLPAILLFTLLFIPSVSGWCQQEALFKRYTVEDGLPSSEVHEIRQDARGFIWIATDRGVCRFDGYEFSVYTSDDGLCDNVVFNMCEDTAGRMWFHTFSGAICRYDGGSIRSLAYDREQVLSFALKLFSESIYADEYGTLWINKALNGSYRLSSSGDISRFAAAEDCRPGTLIARYWNQRDCHFDIKRDPKRFDRTHTLRLIRDDRRRDIDLRLNVDGRPNYLLDLIVLPDERILLRYGHKVYEIGGEGLRSVRRFAHPTLTNNKLLDRDQDLWLGFGLGGGVQRFRGADLKQEPLRYLDGCSITGILQDHEGSIWFATLESGLYYLRSKNVGSYTEAQGLEGNKINVLAPGRRAVWCGTHAGGLHRIDIAGTGESVTTLGRSYDEVRALHEDRSGRLWTSSLRGVRRLTAEHRGDGTIGPGFPLDFLEAPDGSMMYMRRNILVRIRGEHLQSDSLPFLSPSYFKALALPSDSSILIGSLNGLFAWNPHTGAHYSYADDYPLLRHRIADIEIDSLGRICCASIGAGLLILDGDSLQQIDRRRGLSSNMCHKLALDGPRLWVSTNNGLNKLEAGHIETFTTLDGLASNEVNDVILHHGRIWAATEAGLTVFAGDAALASDSPPPLYFTGISINNRDTLIRPAYRLGHSQNDIRIRYVGLSFANALSTLYRYRLDGLDSVWRLTKHRSVEFPALPPGDYCLQLQVRSRGGIWSPEALRLPFSIATPWWRSWPVRTGGILVLCGLIWLGLARRMARLRRTLELQQRSLRAEQIALRAQMNPHFMFNSLNSIQSMIAREERRDAMQYLARFANLMRAILHHSRQSSISLEQETDTLRLYLDLESLRFRGKFTYGIKLADGLPLAEVRIPPLLVQPYVENAIWHGLMNKDRPGGRVDISFWQVGDCLLCSIQDDGVGRRRAAKLRGRGPKPDESLGMRVGAERLHNLGKLFDCPMQVRVCDLHDKDGAAAGTRIELSLPLRIVRDQAGNHTGNYAGNLSEVVYD